MADRTAVPLDQAASLYPQVPRQQRERHSAANPRGDDRLSAAAHRGAGPLHHHAANPSRSARQPTPVLATHDYPNRQTYTGQPQQPQTTQMPRPDGVLLCLTFPRTAVRTRGEVEQAAWPAHLALSIQAENALAAAHPAWIYTPSRHGRACPGISLHMARPYPCKRDAQHKAGHDESQRTETAGDPLRAHFICRTCLWNAACTAARLVDIVESRPANRC